VIKSSLRLSISAAENITYENIASSYFAYVVVIFSVVVKLQYTRNTFDIIYCNKM